MRLYGALILFMILSTACGLKCYTCLTHPPKSCTRILNCPQSMDRCFTEIVGDYLSKGCKTSINCEQPGSCCDEDLCNSAIPTGPSVIFLLVSSAITTLFL